MSTTTRISWADKTWNPTVGCSRVPGEPGCENCYAEPQARRQDRPGSAYQGTTRLSSQGPRWTGRVNLLEDRLNDPLRWRRPSRVFVDSMSDLFHETVPTWYLAEVFATMAQAGQHSFQILTKRAERMRSLVNGHDLEHRVRGVLEQRTGAPVLALQWPLPHAWLGVSASDQAGADARIPELLAIEGLLVPWVSAEPLVEAVDLRPHLGRLRWVVAGGESGGRRARPMHPAWPQALRDQCVSAGVAFHFKQWGAWAPAGVPISVDSGGVGDLVYAEDGSLWPDGGSLAGCQRWWPWEDDSPRHHQWPDGSTAVKVSAREAGRLLDGRTWDEYPDDEEHERHG